MSLNSMRIMLFWSPKAFVAMRKTEVSEDKQWEKQRVVCACKGTIHLSFFLHFAIECSIKKSPPPSTVECD